MAIFSRRVLQYMINENAKILSKDQLDKHICDLNNADEKSLGFEWEVALIYGFSQIGKVVHAPNLKGTSKVDLYFTLNLESGQSFIADITTVSDRGYEAENPQAAFTKELLKIIRKYKLQPNSFSVEIGGESEGPYRNRKMKLKLPAKGQLKNILDEKFYDFMRTIAKKPSSRCSHFIETDSAEVVIEYNPERRDGFSLNFPAYNVAYSLEKNPIYNALKDKANQLKKASYGGPVAIILCDGGCRLFKDRGIRGLNYNARDIIQHFLSKNSSISFVLTFYIERSNNWFKPLGDPHLKIQLYPNSVENIGKDLLDCMNKLNQVLPKPVNDAGNALNRLKSLKHNVGLSFYGGMKMTNNTISISARALHELLAGRVSQKKFLEDHRLIPTQTHPDDKNFFELRLQEGRMIEEIEVERSKIEDDDWLIIKFRKPDPSISPFKPPSYYWLLKIKQKLRSFLLSRY